MWNRRQEAGVVRAALMVTCLAGSSLVLSAAEAGTTVSLTQNGDGAVRLQPGETGTITLRAQSSAAFHADLGFSGADDAEYQVTNAPSAGCPVLEPTTAAATSRDVIFDPSAAGGDLSCTYTVQRSASSTNDLAVYLSVLNVSPWQFVDVNVGAVPVLTFWVRQESVALLPDGRARSVMRLSLSNASDVSFAGAGAGYCTELTPPAFSMNGNIPEGCGAIGGYHGICLTGGDYGIEFPPAPAHGLATCLLELTSTDPYTQPLYYGIESTIREIFSTTTGGVLYPRMNGQSGSLLTLSLDAVFGNGFQ